jgi:hypothetical protein
VPRDHSRIHTDIWGDDDWLDLSPGAQHLYFVLYTWPPSLCGAGDWQPRKAAARARGWTVPDVLDAADELVAGDFTLIDLDTEEYLLRSWIKHDGLYRVQNMAVSIANARANLASRTLKAIVVHEVAKLRKAEPDLESWKKDAVRNMLDQKAIDPDDVEWSSPWDSPSVSSWASGKVSPKVAPEPSPSASSRATPSPAPSPNSKSSTELPRKRGARLPEDWMPSQDSIDAVKAECPLVNLEAEHRKFADYWKAKSGRDAAKLDWDATWRNWIRNARPPQTVSASGSTVDDKVNGWMDLANSTPGRELE